MVDPQSGCQRQRAPAYIALARRPYMCLLVDEMCYVMRMEHSRTGAAVHVIVTEVGENGVDEAMMPSNIEL